MKQYLFKCLDTDEINVRITLLNTIAGIKYNLISANQIYLHGFVLKIEIREVMQSYLTEFTDIFPL